MQTDPYIKFRRGELPAREQSVLAEGFRVHSDEQDAPQYAKRHVSWVRYDEHDAPLAILTADVLWDWLYVDELWVSEDCREEGLGRQLMERAEAFGLAEELQGVWLWTQSWQAEDFYKHLGYEEFTRFENFPKGYSRVGFRKRITSG